MRRELEARLIWPEDPVRAKPGVAAGGAGGGIRATEGGTVAAAMLIVALPAVVRSLSSGSAESSASSSLSPSAHSCTASLPVGALARPLLSAGVLTLISSTMAHTASDTIESVREASSSEVAISTSALRHAAAACSTE
jgi:O-acetyl-ADP-ribose deacetylase (regulator of RNase III)